MRSEGIYLSQNGQVGTSYDFYCRSASARIASWRSDGSLFRSQNINRSLLNGFINMSPTGQQAKSHNGSPWHGGQPETYLQINTRGTYLHPCELKPSMSTSNDVSPFCSHSLQAPSDYTRKSPRHNNWKRVYQNCFTRPLSPTVVLPDPNYCLRVPGGPPRQPFEVYDAATFQAIQNRPRPDSIDLVPNSIRHVSHDPESTSARFDRSSSQLYISGVRHTMSFVFFLSLWLEV